MPQVETASQCTVLYFYSSEDCKEASTHIGVHGETNHPFKYGSVGFDLSESFFLSRGT